jgi:hypothetical protein
VIGRLARFCGAMVDARSRPHTGDACELAATAGWIASNLLAARGVRVGRRADDRHGAGIVRVRVSDLGGLLAAIAVMPALIDASTVPPRWRVALRALGLPLLDRTPDMAVASGASVVIVEPSPRMAATLAISVGADELGYRVMVAPAPRALAHAS